MKINLTKKFPKKVLAIVNTVGEIADKRTFRVYIVGGLVRDLLLGTSNYDLDFVVDGDGIEFAKALNGYLKGELKIHRAFKTATLMHKGLRIDISTARGESYKKPAAYPDVRPGTIKEDLFRRDFTINAMAVSVNKKTFGQLIDLYGGAGDLKKGIIRVMHDKSFSDDPTRVFRAVRFSARFDFKIESHTKDLIKKAVLSGLLGDVNRGRIKKEVDLFLKEKEPKKCFGMFADLV
ncbi:MAG: hypothetical protein KKH08_05515 [Candidatus Omnitrophica bacterium]|nr:hypothetical protein [Candidatus Omnitrophota bacterium]